MNRVNSNRTVRGAHVRLRLQVERIKTWCGVRTTPTYAWLRCILGKQEASSVQQPKLEALEMRRWHISSARECANGKRERVK